MLRVSVSVSVLGFNSDSDLASVSICLTCRLVVLVLNDRLEDTEEASQSETTNTPDSLVNCLSHVTLISTESDRVPASCQEMRIACLAYLCLISTQTATASSLGDNGNYKHCECET